MFGTWLEFAFSAATAAAMDGGGGERVNGIVEGRNETGGLRKVDVNKLKYKGFHDSFNREDMQPTT